MRDELRISYIMSKRYVVCYVIVVTAIACFLGFGAIHSTNFAKDSSYTTEDINTGLAENMELYAGVFSTSVTNAVNPSATLTVLSIIGTIENYDAYFPQSKGMDSIANFFNGIPFLRIVQTLPIANPYAAGLFGILMIVMYVMKSTAATKAISEATTDKVENACGFLASIVMAFLPMTCSTVAAAEMMASEKRVVSLSTFVITVIVGIITAIFSGIIYICVNGTIDAIEAVAAIIPIPNANLFVQICRVILHSILVVLQIFAPIISVIISVILMIAGFILFRYAYLYTQYYGAVYVQTTMNRIFHKNREYPLRYKKSPRRLVRQYDHADVILPVFAIAKYEKMKRKQKLWFIYQDQTAYFVRHRWIRKPVVLTMDIINKDGSQVYIHKGMRFVRILTENKKVDFVMSSVYGAKLDTLLEVTGYADYQTVVDANPTAVTNMVNTVKGWFGGKKREVI